VNFQIVQSVDLESKINDNEELAQVIMMAMLVSRKIQINVLK